MKKLKKPLKISAKSSSAPQPSAKPTKIVTFPYQDTGVGFYRVLQPGRVMKRLGLYDEAVTYPFSGDNQGHFFDHPDSDYMYLTKGATLMWSTIVFKQEYIIRLLNLRKHWQTKLIFDIDDNLYAVPKDNPAAEFVEPLRRNFEACLRVADGVTVSVPQLKTLYSALNPNIHVMPNAFDLKIWNALHPKLNRNKRLRIGWRGAHGHKDDFETILPVLEALKKVYNVEVVCFGIKPPNFECEHHDWVTFFDYPAKLASLALDLAVVPLVDSAYNRCKSNLAWLDYSALKIPTVLSPTENHLGLPALFAETKHDWYEAISGLLESKDKRLELGERAYRHLKEHYDVTKVVPDTKKWFDSLPFRTDF
jgi:hypothetical protein